MDYLQRVAMAALGQVFALALVLLALWLSLSAVRAHDWFDWECCSAQDCEMVKGSPDSIVFRAGKWVLPNGEEIDPADTRQSPDREFYWCRHAWEGPDAKIVKPYKQHACLYVPGGGV